MGTPNRCEIKALRFSRKGSKGIFVETSEIVGHRHNEGGEITGCTNGFLPDKLRRELPPGKMGQAINGKIGNDFTFVCFAVDGGEYLLGECPYRR